MAYADKDRQREYQRLWARNLKDKRVRANTGGSRQIYLHGDGQSFNLKRRSITWEELTREKIEKIDSWDECIKKAKTFVLGRRADQLTIAALAIRACDIKRGGDRRSVDYKNEIEKKNISAFAKKIGVHHKTLQNWVFIKTKVIDELPENARIINWTAATKAYNNYARDGIKPAEAYKRYSDEDPFVVKANVCSSYLRNSAKILTTLGTRGWRDEQVEEARVNMGAIMRALNKGEQK